MAITPLFLASTTEIKSRLRLTGVQTSGEVLIEDALEWTRVQFYRRLGTSQVATLLGYSYSEAPTTEAGIKRSLANQTEIKLVRAHLLRTMSTLHRDGSAQARELWNQEGFFRTKSAQEVEKEIARIMSEVEDAFDLLSGAETLGNDTSARATCIGPDQPFHRTAKGFNIYGD